MGKLLIIKNADFSANAIGSGGKPEPLKIVFIEGPKYGVVAESDYDTTIGNYTFTITFNRNLTESELTDFTDTLTGIVDIEVMDYIDNRVYIRLPEGMIAGGDMISLSSPYYENGDIPFINIFYNLPTFTSVLYPTDPDPTFVTLSGADFQHTYIPSNYLKIGGSIKYVNDGFVGNKFSVKKNNKVISSNISFRDNFLIYNFTSPVTFSVGDTIEFLYNGLTFDSFTVLDL